MPNDHATITCPVCHEVNDPSAVFCKNPQCHKALGEFRYAIEALGAKSKWHETLVSRTAKFIGRPHFVGFHVAWVTLWILVNTGTILMGRAFDVYPFGLLGLILSIEAILITSVLVISTSGQSDLANTRAELDYEVNVQTYRGIQSIQRTLESIEIRLQQIEIKKE